MRTCEEYVIQKLEKAESRFECLKRDYDSLKEMYDYRVGNIRFLLKFFKKVTTSDGHPYYTMTNLVNAHQPLPAPGNQGTH